jgi:hypothetical protein
MDVSDISPADAQMTFILGTPPVPVPYYPLNAGFSDASGSGLHAVGYNFSGASQWANDSFEGSYFALNQSLRFDGADDYAVCSPLVSASNDLTIAFWLKPERLGDMVPLD